MMTKEMRERGQNTYTPSNVMGNQEHAHKNTDKEFSYGLNKKTGNVARDEAKWQSNVFAAPQQNPVNRKLISQNDKGRDGLFGNNEEKDAYMKKKNLAGEMSIKEATRPPVFDDKAAEERKQAELYGTSKYAPQQRTQVGMNQLKEQKNTGDNRYSRKANELQSNVLATDESILREREQRTTWEPAEKLPSSTSGWNSDISTKK